VYDAKEIERASPYLRQYMPENQARPAWPLQPLLLTGPDTYAVQADVEGSRWVGEDWNAWIPAIRDELVRRQSPTQASGR